MNDYWKKREATQLLKNLKDEQVYIEKINGYYDYMMDQIQKEINGFYAKYAKAEGITLSEAKRKVSKLDMEAYERKAKRYVEQKTFTKEANEEMRLYNATMKINRLELLKANIGLELVDGFDELQKYFDTILTERALSEFDRQAGILGKTVKDNAQAAHAIVHASFHNAKFSDRIWMYQDMMKWELSKLLQTGVMQGRNSRELARHLVKLFGVRKSDAERLMRSELARVQTEVQKQSFQRNGYDKYVFLALGNACSDCKTLDNGKPIAVKDMMPGSNAPPIHPNCRCGTAAYMDREVFDKWLENQEKGGTINSGAKKTPGWKDRHAEREYEAIRKRTTDCERIAQNTGLSKSDIEIIKAHMFIENHKFRDGSARRFDADFEQVQAWDRLTQGKQRDIDIILLKHELEEAKIMREKGLVYEDAHELANKKYNWWKEFLEEE